MTTRDRSSSSSSDSIPSLIARAEEAEQKLRDLAHDEFSQEEVGDQRVVLYDAARALRDLLAVLQEQATEIQKLKTELVIATGDADTSREKNLNLKVVDV